MDRHAYNLKHSPQLDEDLKHGLTEQRKIPQFAQETFRPTHVE